MDTKRDIKTISENLRYLTADDTETGITAGNLNASIETIFILVNHDIRLPTANQSTVQIENETLVRSYMNVIMVILDKGKHD